jgi:hypothetical protein
MAGEVESESPRSHLSNMGGNSNQDLGHKGRGYFKNAVSRFFFVHVFEQPRGKTIILGLTNIQV